MKNLSDEDKAWLESVPARKLAQHYANQAALQANAVMSAAMESTDPKVRGLAVGFAVWKAAMKELEYKADD